MQLCYFHFRVLVFEIHASEFSQIHAGNRYH